MNNEPWLEEDFNRFGNVTNETKKRIWFCQRHLDVETNIAEDLFDMISEYLAEKPIYICAVNWNVLRIMNGSAGLTYST
jgi:hypothetical protein